MDDLAERLEQAKSDVADAALELFDEYKNAEPKMLGFLIADSLGDSIKEWRDATEALLASMHK